MVAYKTHMKHGFKHLNDFTISTVFILLDPIKSEL